MLLMWAISAGLVYLILGLPAWLVALIGALVTATDPVAASAIVTGSVAEENIPERLRHAVSLVVCASVVAHGMTGAPVTRWFGRVAGLRSGGKRE
jgi:NhaP-type Na+/H+ or K+/H+ antiporter